MNYETSIRVQDDAYGAEADSGARRRRAIIVGVLVLAIAAAIAFVMFRRGADDAAPGAAAAENGKAGKAQVPSVTVIIPGREQVSRALSATGVIAARREMPVGVVGEGGQVTRVMVEPGQWVGDGQVLAVIERSVQSQQAASLAAQVAVAEADARLAQQELERAQTLVSRGFISKADVDRRTATRDAQRARVRVAQAQLREAQARTGRLDIRAPAAGLVLTRDIEPGQVVSPGSGVLFRIAQGGQLELRAQVSEADLQNLRAGATATVTPVGSPRSFTGQVWQVSPVIDATSRQGTARIALGYDPALRPGGFAQANIVTGSADAPVLPESAVLSDAQGNFVYIVDANNKIVRRPVRTGQVSAVGIAIAEGLAGNERVVQAAGAFVNPGQTVQPERAPAPAR